MSQEIELKFIVSPHAVAQIKEMLNQLAGSAPASCHLTNHYFETDDKLLRRHDMGLRIRGRDTQYEMTLKTAGEVTGGLHQRPEYNCALDTPVLDLAKLPANVWPAGWTADALQAQLKPLFRTDFTRDTWTITHEKSQIELALDQGEVVAGEHHEPLIELELELLEGETAALFSLAEALQDIPGLRMGYLSKAARGYHLAAGMPERSLKPLSVLHVPAKISVEQGMEMALTEGLNSWLYHEELWSRGNTAAIVLVTDAVIRIRAILALYSHLITRKASGALRDSLMWLETQLQATPEDDSLLFSPETGRARLQMTRWLVMKPWQVSLTDKSRTALAGSFKRFSDIQLSRHSAELKTFFQSSASEHDLNKLPRLLREIMTLRTLAGCYPEEATIAWLDNWQGLYQAMTDNQPSVTAYFRKTALQQAPFWRHSGQ